MDVLYRLEEDHAVITGAMPGCMVLQIPEQIEGRPVRRIAPRAFEGSRFPVVHLPEGLKAIGAYAFHDCAALGEITLPDSLREVGPYAFYDCRGLRRLTLADGIRAIDNDSFLGCDALTHVTMTLVRGRHQALKTMLSELFQEVCVDLIYPSGAGENAEERRARIVFPEYFVEYVENHPARIFEEFTIGSGRVYRKCFSEPDFDYRAYDEHFGIACLKDLAPQAARVAVARLQFPYRLGGAAKERYTKWLREHAPEACAQYVEQDDVETLRFLHESGVIDAGNADAFLDMAGRRHAEAALAWLMQIGRRSARAKESNFEL